MSSHVESRILTPGTEAFREFLKHFQVKINKMLDDKVRLGTHEPGHGSVHVEMVLFIFQGLAKAFGFTSEQNHVGSLAVMCHDLWREHVYESHAEKSAEAARSLLMSRDIFSRGELPQTVIEQVLKIVANHSHRSHRAKGEDNVQPEYQVPMLVLQAADILATAGGFGYLRAFSYSGHVMHSYMQRIPFLVQNPKKFQSPLPKNLRRLLSISGNHMHAWILSLMLRTNQNYVARVSDSVIRQFVMNVVASGVNVQKVMHHTELIVQTDQNGNPNAVKGLKKPVKHSQADFNISAMRKENYEHFEYFCRIVDRLDDLSCQGLDADGNVPTEYEQDVLEIMGSGLLGLCSRVFWGQFNPIQLQGISPDEHQYPTLAETIDRFRFKHLDSMGDGSHASLRTELGKDIYEQSIELATIVVERSIAQLEHQRFTPEMWDETAP